VVSGLPSEPPSNFKFVPAKPNKFIRKISEVLHPRKQRAADMWTNGTWF
jgi:hypothetical protein